MTTIDVHGYIDKVGKYFADHVVFRVLSVLLGINSAWNPTIFESDILLFSLQGGRQDCKPRKLSPVIAPDIWALGKNNLEQ